MAMQYIGARYVPIFYTNPDDGSASWKANVDYESFTIVVEDGDSYTSKKSVPSGIGKPSENPEYWVKTGDFNASLLALQNRVSTVENDLNNPEDGVKAKIEAINTLDGDGVLNTEADTFTGAINEIDENIKSAFVTPQMFGAKGDGTTDDTAAFETLADESGNVLIPKGNYVINSKVVIANVIGDYGSYTNYKPMYAKKLELPLDKLSAIHKNVPLNSVNEYEESMCKIGNRYYVITNEHVANTNGIIVYDEDFNILSHVSSAKTTVGTCNSCCTDGTYLYIDYDTNYHRKYSVTDLTTPIIEVNTNYRNTCYDNKTLYAVNIDEHSISVSVLDETMTELSDTWSVANERSTLQSSMMFNGALYITTFTGNFTVVDLVSHEVLNVDYQAQPVEIEAFFEDNGKLCASIHLINAGGFFDIAAFDSGVTYPPINYYEIDASVERFAVTTVAAYRNGIYHVVNGKTAGVLPADDCVILWAEKNIICYSVVENGIWVYRNNNWYLKGLFAPITIQLGSGLYITLTTNNTLTIVANYHLESDDVTFNIDLSDIYSKLNWGDSEQVRFNATCCTYGAAPMASDVYAIHGLISKTSVKIWGKSLLGVDVSVNAYVTGRIFVTA